MANQNIIAVLGHSCHVGSFGTVSLPPPTRFKKNITGADASSIQKYKEAYRRHIGEMDHTFMQSASTRMPLRCEEWQVVFEMRTILELQTNISLQAEQGLDQSKEFNK